MTTGIRIQRAKHLSKTLKPGDHVSWNSEAGRVRGVIIKKVTSDVDFSGYVHHATKDKPQYLIRSDRTDHIAIHKGRVLRLLKPQRARKPSRSRGKRA